MTSVSDAAAPVSAGTCWSGRFNHPDTTALLGLDTHGFLYNKLNEKRWCYIGVFHPQMIFGCAVVHLGYISSAFVFAFDRESKSMTEHSVVLPPLGQARYDRNPENGVCSFRSFNGHLRLSHSLPDSPTRVETLFRIPGKSLKADIDIQIPTTGCDPMHFLMPMEKGRRAFTTKSAGLCANGRISVNSRTLVLDPKDTVAVLDWTNGYYPRHTFWNWACGAGTAEDNTRIGFNFSAGVYTSGQLENVVWVNGTPHQTGPVDFVYDTKNPMAPWQISSPDGQVDLVFRPEGIRQANDDFKLLASRFIQPCGSYSGTIRLGDQQEISLDRAPGVAEEHFAKW